MAVFPQLATGASTHYPAVKTRRSSTLVNTMADGRSIKLADAGADTAAWQLTYAELADSEKATLEDFFARMEGSLQSFTFLDPAGNLLSWSEKLDEPVWEKGPLIATAGGQRDPLGTMRASTVRNTAGGAQSVQQTLEAPANYVYAFSLYARAAAPVEVALFRGTDRQQAAVATDWSRLVLPGQSTAAGDSLAFGLELPAGCAVDVFGLQVEAQPAPSRYQRTEEQGGVYEARFQNDLLRFTTEGPQRHACVIQIIHANHI